MGAIIDLWKSERGLMAMALIIASFVLTLTGKVSTEVWVDYSKWIFVTYAAAKAVTSVAETRAGRETDLDGAPPGQPKV